MGGGQPTYGKFHMFCRFFLKASLRRCKIEFWTTFVFYTKLIFPHLFELEHFETSKKRLKITNDSENLGDLDLIAPTGVEKSIW